MSAALPVKPNLLTISVAAVGDAVVVGVFELPEAGGRRDVQPPSCQSAPCGKRHLVGEDRAACRSGRRHRCLRAARRSWAGLLQLAAVQVLTPALSATNSRPRSSKPAIIGCSTSGGAATSSTVKPSGTEIAGAGRRRAAGRRGARSMGSERGKDESQHGRVSEESRAGAAVVDCHCSEGTGHWRRIDCGSGHQTATIRACEQGGSHANIPGSGSAGRGGRGAMGSRPNNNSSSSRPRPCSFRRSASSRCRLRSRCRMAAGPISAA